MRALVALALSSRLATAMFSVSNNHTTSFEMARHTKKVGITGKYGTRYGRAARKQLLTIEVQQRARYTCPFCAKDKVTRDACGIWTCRCCKKQMAGAAYTLTSQAGNSIKATVRRIRQM